MTISRRAFVESAAVALAGLRTWNVRPGTAPALPLAFSTLGCPEWSWATILDFAAEHGYAAIELRGLGATMDLTQAPELAPGKIEEARYQLARHKLRIACVSSSANMHEMDAATRRAQLDEARRYVELAHALDAPYVRVFGNELVEGVTREAMIAHVAAGLREVGEYARPRGVTVLLESHGDFTDSATLLDVLQRAASPGVALLWDAHHTFVSAQEQPADTERRLRPYIRHTHLKDSVPPAPGEKDRRYVLAGTGDVPVWRQIDVLARSGYRGYYTFEWEKRWHPEIEAPEVAIAHFAKAVRGYADRG